MAAITAGLVVLAPAVFGATATLTFDVSKLDARLESHSIAYADFQSVATGTEISLPVREYYIDLSPFGDKPTIDFSVALRTGIGSVDAQNALGDIPTTDNPEEYQAALAARWMDRLGSEAVRVSGYIRSGHRLLARLIVFPVTIEDDGQCYFNRQITILINSQPVGSGSLFADAADLTSSQVKLPSASLSLTEGGIDYVVVTSGDLIESVQPLVAYRNAVGTATCAVNIDDILGSYAGRDDAEKLREYLKDFYAAGGSYVLLVGDETRLPIRYTYPYNVSTMPSLPQLQICDLYFGDLTGDWDADNDGIWGERYVDLVDLTPEIFVGRLPFNTADEVNNYISKLIIYETDPGNGEPEYLQRAFFFSSDQMRDLNQHGIIADVYPDHMAIDTSNGLEQASGEDLSPTNRRGDEIEGVLSDGYGIVNIIAHGTTGSFAVRTSGYNEWPKSYFTTNSVSVVDGLFDRLDRNSRTSLYYALSCDVGGFDMDQPPFNSTTPNLVQTALSLADAGAVAFVANSRWGWVSSSYLFQRDFFASLAANPDQPIVRALHEAKAGLPYYLDQIHGLNYFGDPMLKAHLGAPRVLSAETSFESGNLVVAVTSDSAPVTDCEVILSQDGVVLERSTTNGQGCAIFTYDLAFGDEYTIGAVADGYAVYHSDYTPSLLTDVDGPVDELPGDFVLHQNYPNPFNPTTVISFELPKGAAARLSVVNILGQEVNVLTDGYLSAGTHEVAWNGDDHNGNGVASGMYFYRLEAEDFNCVRKMLLVR